MEPLLPQLEIEQAPDLAREAPRLLEIDEHRRRIDEIAALRPAAAERVGEPIPERASEPELGGVEGFKIFESLVGAMVEK